MENSQTFQVCSAEQHRHSQFFLSSFFFLFFLLLSSFPSFPSFPFPRCFSCFSTEMVKVLLLRFLDHSSFPFFTLRRRPLTLRLFLVPHACSSIPPSSAAVHACKATQGLPVFLVFSLFSLTQHQRAASLPFFIHLPRPLLSPPFELQVFSTIVVRAPPPSLV